MSSVTYIARKLLKGLQAGLISKIWDRKIFFLQHDYPGEISRHAQGVTFNLLNLTIKRNSLEFVLDSYETIRELRTSVQATLFLKDDRLFVDIRGIVINVTTSEECFILNEVFVKGIYNFDINRPCSVIDVGMNVGIASLFFASFPQVERVFAFEPFKPTFAQGQLNIDNNVALSTKMKLANFGLGARDETLEVTYDYSNKGQVGIHGTGLVRSHLQRVEKQAIEIRDASRVLKAILEENPDATFILKLDCEGSEYGILQTLTESGLLIRFKMVFIEWHDQGPEPLLTHLRCTGFVSFYQQTSETVGMIYASR